MTDELRRFIPTAFQPTDEQKRIQMAHERVVIVEANAGAAKTTTLALRIGEALARGMPPESILALVFTAEAREVMRKRLVEVGISSNLAALVRVETFDSLADAVLRDFEGVSPPSIASAKMLRPYVLKTVEQVSEKFRHKFDGLDIATHNIAVSQFLDVQMTTKARMALDRDWEDAGREDVAEILGITLTHLLCLGEYEYLRLGSFDEAKFRGPFDATYDLARYLESRPEVSESLPSCRVVVCDELHDMNEASFRVLMALLNKGRSFFIGAGDKDQVIHATLGADSQFLRERFDAHFASVCRLPLSASYRHGPHLSLAMGKFKGKRSDSSLPTKTTIVRSTYPDGDWERCADLVVQALEDWERDTGSSGGCAILIRDRHQSIVIENALMRREVGYRCNGMKGYLQREEILFMRGMLAIALGDLASVQSKEVRKAIVESLVVFGDVDLKGSHRIEGGSALSHDAALERAKTMIADAPEMLNVFFSARFEDGKSNALSSIVEAVEFVRKQPHESPADEVLQGVLAKMKIDSVVKRIYVYPHEAEVVLRSVEGFIDLAIRSGMSLKGFSEWIGGTEAQVSKRKYKNLVTLERVETSKGKEYPHVILPFLEAGEFPSSSSSALEEENLFYVGATRAKSRLTLLLPDNPQRQSPFVARMGMGSSLSAKADSAIEKNSAQITTASRIDLNVPFEAKDKAKELGARWDPVRKTWFIEAGVNSAPFKCWIKS